jgi:hypothetical protein
VRISSGRCGRRETLLCQLQWPTSGHKRGERQPRDGAGMFTIEALAIVGCVVQSCGGVREVAIVQISLGAKRTQEGTFQRRGCGRPLARLEISEDVGAKQCFASLQHDCKSLMFRKSLGERWWEIT